MKTIGLIGGMSYSSTIIYYDLLNKYSNEYFGDLTTPKILLSSVNFSMIEELQHQGNWIDLGSLLNKEARSLEKAGAEVLALCTNTMHKVTKEMLANVSIPFTHIAEATAKEITKGQFNKPALLATKFTMEEDFYIEKLIDYGLEPIIPKKESRDILHTIIYDELCFNVTTEESRDKFIAISQEVENAGADSVILGCTEVGMLLNDENINLPVYDTVKVHCKEIFNSIL
jgi:aspartate racemase